MSPKPELIRKPDLTRRNGTDGRQPSKSSPGEGKGKPYQEVIWRRRQPITPVRPNPLVRK